jgi:hypothetical protein
MRALLAGLGLICIIVNHAYGVENELTSKGASAQQSNNRIAAKKSPSQHNHSPSHNTVYGSALAKPATRNTFFFGRVYHEVSEPYNEHASKKRYTKYHNYRGLRAAFQHEHSNHIASLHAIESGKLDTVTIENKDRNDMIYNLNLSESVRYLGVKSSIIASTNLNKGWQFYIGSGLFYDTYLKESGNSENFGVRYDFGLGHSWYHCQAMLRFSGDLTNSQSNSNTESAEVVIDFGYNF